MTRRNDIDVGHTRVETMHVLGTAQSLVALLRDGISIARASNKFTGRANKRGSESTREAQVGKEHGAASDHRDTRSNHHGESAAPGDAYAWSAAKLVSRIATVKRAIDRFERQQNSWRKDMSGVALGAERSLDVSRIEKNIETGNDGAPSVSIARLMRQEGMAHTPLSRPNFDAARLVAAMRLLEDSSVKRALGAGISPSSVGPPSRQLSLSDRSGRYDSSKRPGFLDAAASIAAQPNNFAAPPIRQVEFAEPTKGQSRGSAGTSGGISIQSSPTVIINSGESRSDIERQVEGALRKHRDQLFDELKQEAGRRERAEY